VDSGTLVTSGGFPAWDYKAPDNLSIDGISNTDFLDSWYIADADDTIYLYPANKAKGNDYGFVAEDGSTSTTTQYDYGSAVLYVNGTAPTISDRDDVHTALNGRKLVHHQSGDCDSWNDFQVGRYANASSGSTYHYGGKMQAILLWDSDQSGNKSAIEASLNSYYDIY
jgi:hypothetical protein